MSLLARTKKAFQPSLIAALDGFFCVGRNLPGRNASPGLGNTSVGSPARRSRNLVRNAPADGDLAPLDERKQFPVVSLQKELDQCGREWTKMRRWGKQKPFSYLGLL